MKKRALALVVNFFKAIRPSSTLLDVGCGTGHVAQCLGRLGFRVTGVDICNSKRVSIRFVQATAKSLPFATASFDYVLFCTVLHHLEARDHGIVLAEARRIARVGIIIVEDVYDTTWELYLTKIIDRIVNIEFGHHPHSNRTVDEWHKVLENAGLVPNTLRVFSLRYLGLPVKHAVIMGHR